MKGLVVIPSYNTGGEVLVRTVREVLLHWPQVWVIVDGSTDGSDAVLENQLGASAGLRIRRLPKNQGKGAAVLSAAAHAQAEGFTHVCSFDSDGQHCAADIPRMFARLEDVPEGFVLGVPQFGPEAPPERVKGRRVGNGFATLETLGMGPAVSLYGLRIYPVGPLLKVMRGTARGRRYDFDTEAAVRLTWAGVQAINVPTPVRYLSREEGGISHFKYLRDNVLLTCLHTRLLCELPFHVPALLRARQRTR